MRAPVLGEQIGPSLSGLPHSIRAIEGEVRSARRWRAKLARRLYHFSLVFCGVHAEIGEVVQRHHRQAGAMPEPAMCLSPNPVIPTSA